MSGDRIINNVFKVVSALIFAIVLVRLFELQVVNGSKYRSFVDSQIGSKLVVNKNRGYIYDKGGNVLAQNRTVASVYTYGKNVGNVKEFSDKLLKNGISISAKTKDSLKKQDGFIWLERRIELSRAEAIRKSMQGVDYFKEEARFYPQGGVMASLIGFTGADNDGRAGIEYVLNKELGGTKVTLATLRDSRGRYILFDDKNDVLKPDSEIHLTIPLRVQAMAEHILRAGAEQFGAKDGAVVAMDIKTGEIIVAADVRSFDPHNYSKYPNNTWKNYAFTHVFEPGSIFKTVAFCYLFDNDKLNLSKKIDTNKKITISGYTYSDTKDYGVLSVDEVFTHSSNIGMVHLVVGEKNADFHSFLSKAGFGAKTGVFGVPEESGRLKLASSWSPTSRTSMAIGYEVMVTPLQMVRFYAAVANGGVMVTPKVISKLVKNGEESEIAQSSMRIMKKETADYILSLMRRTVEDGTGINANSSLVHIAGKTGTASIYDAKSGQYSKQNYTASFAGVFPSDNPRVAMVVVYESPTRSIYGGSTSANVFRQIAEYISTEVDYIELNARTANASR